MDVSDNHYELSKKISRAKVRLLQMHYFSNVGHIGGNLSCLDTLMCLYHQVMKTKDMFVLSKGHAAGALYITLWSIGKLSEQDLETFHKDGTRLGGHPSASQIPDILFSTGSLGHGLSLAAGLAAGKLIKGDLNEGSSWEAILFAVHQKLKNLTFIIDANGLQGFGTVSEVSGLQALQEKLMSFGIDVYETNGHEVASLVSVLSKEAERPIGIIAHTVKGKGVSFMEHQMQWHYLPLNEQQYRQALNEVDNYEE